MRGRIIKSVSVRRNPKAVGEASEAAILAALLRSGYSVSIPFGNNQRYDLIIDDGQRLQRVQCKTGRLRNGVLGWEARNRGGDYRGQVEFFAVFEPSAGATYLVPVELVPRKFGSLRVEHGGATRADVRWAADYLVLAPGDIRPEPPARYLCIDCGAPRSPSARRCRACLQLRGRSRSKIVWPARPELLDMLSGSTLVQVGRTLGVTPKAVRDHLARTAGADAPPRASTPKGGRARSVDWPSDAELAEGLATTSVMRLAADLGVSDAGLRRHLKRRAIPLPSRAGKPASDQELEWLRSVSRDGLVEAARSCGIAPHELRRRLAVRGLPITADSAADYLVEHDAA